MRAAALVLAALCVVALAAQIASGALAAPSEAPKRPSLRVASEPLFALRGLKPGDRASRCVDVDAQDAGHISFFGGGENGPLAPHVHVKLLRGCNSEEVLFEGRLDRLPLEPDAVPAAGNAYRVEVEVLSGAPPAARASASFGFGADAAQTSGAGGGTTRADSGETRVAHAAPCTVRRNVRLGRVDASVTARWGGGRLRLKTALRMRGKTLRQRWATVAYRVGASRWRTTRRPFHLTTPEADSVMVRIRPTRRRSATVRLRVCGGAS